MTDTKMLKALNHWVLFELTLSIGGVFYLFYYLGKYWDIVVRTIPWVYVVAILLLIVRAIILYRLWYSTNPTAGIDTADDSVPDYREPEIIMNDSWVNCVIQDCSNKVSLGKSTKYCAVHINSDGE